MTALSDWNDLHVAAGIHEVRRQVLGALERIRLSRAANMAPAPAPEPVPEQTCSSPNDERAQAPDAGDARHDNWQAHLLRTDKGGLIAHANNVITILKHDEHCRDLIAFNEFSLRAEKRRAPAWGGGEGDWTDSDDLRLMYWLGQTFHLNVKADACAQAVKKVGDDAPFHPVREYLQGLRWDGVPRLACWLHTYLGAEANEYSFAVARKWLISAVARIMRPGCKADGVLILFGSQGRGKSTALHVLGGEWFLDTPLPIGQKDAFEMIRGRWIVELGELDSLNKVESTAAKTFFSSAEDTYRPSYGRHSVTSPRQCVFAGTTNHYVHLKDPTGNRRYWSVCVGNIDLEALRRDRDQLWAEAMVAFRDGVPWHVDGSEKHLFDEAQERHRLADPFEDTIISWLDDPGRVTQTDWKSETILLDCLKVPAERLSTQLQSRVVAILERHGYRRVRPRTMVDGKRSGYVYRRPCASDERGEWP